MEGQGNVVSEREFWDIVESINASPITIPTDATTKSAYEKKNITAQQILLDAIKDHVIPRIKEKVMHMRCGMLYQNYTKALMKIERWCFVRN